MRNVTNQNLSKYLIWNNFQIRNADNLTGAFEGMCKALFARKLRVQVADILEYKNQTGVECEPYVKHGEGWSFQAKFSDTKKVDFSAFRKSLFKAFEFKSTGEYKNLTQIICYTNENPIRKGTIRKEIEKQALKKSITIDWYFGKRILERLEESEYSDIRLHYFGGGQNLTLNPPVSTPSKSLSALKYQAEVTKFTGRSQETYNNLSHVFESFFLHYFNIAVETCRCFSKKNIGDEKLHLGGLLKGSFEHYLKTEDFKSLCNLCDKTSELQQFEFVDTNHFLLNAPSTMLSSYPKRQFV